MAEIQCSLGAFPLTPSLKDQCGLPFGCVVRPLARSLDNPTATSSSSNGDAAAGTALPRASEVARCQECYGYVSGFCQFTRYGWTCALCGAYTEYSRGSEYAKTTSRRARPELQADNVELELWRANAGGVLEQVGCLHPLVLAPPPISHPVSPRDRPQSKRCTDGCGGTERAQLCTMDTRLDCASGVGLRYGIQRRAGLHPASCRKP